MKWTDVTADTTVDVLYLQTPYSFIDVRCPRPGVETKESVLAFARVTTVEISSSQVFPLVHWHACIET